MVNELRINIGDGEEDDGEGSRLNAMSDVENWKKVIESSIFGQTLCSWCQTVEYIDSDFCET